MVVNARAVANTLHKRVVRTRGKRSFSFSSTLNSVWCRGRRRDPRASCKIQTGDVLSVCSFRRRLDFEQSEDGKSSSDKYTHVTKFLGRFRRTPKCLQRAGKKIDKCVRSYGASHLTLTSDEFRPLVLRDYLYDRDLKIDISACQK